MWSAKVRSLTVGKKFALRIWDTLTCRTVPPPVAELPPQGRWDAGRTALLRDRASGWGELQQFVLYFLRAITLSSPPPSYLSLVCSPCISFCSFLFFYFILLHFVTHFPPFCILFSCGLLNDIISKYTFTDFLYFHFLLYSFFFSYLSSFSSAFLAYAWLYVFLFLFIYSFFLPRRVLFLPFPSAYPIPYYFVLLSSS